MGSMSNFVCCDCGKQVMEIDNKSHKCVGPEKQPGEYAHQYKERLKNCVKVK